MPPRKRGGRPRGSASSWKGTGRSSPGAEDATAHGVQCVLPLIPALRPVQTPARRSMSRAGSEAPKQVRIKSPTPSRTPPFYGGIVGEASPERVRSSQSYEHLLASPSPSVPAISIANSDSELSSPSVPDLPIVGELDSDAEPQSPSLSDLPIVGELDSDAEPPSPSLSDLPIVGELDSDADIGSVTAADVTIVAGVESDVEPPSPSLSDLPIVGELESDAEAGSATGADLNNLCEVQSDTGAYSTPPADAGMVRAMVYGNGEASLTRMRSERDVVVSTVEQLREAEDTVRILQSSPLTTTPRSWREYQASLLRNGTELDKIWSELQSATGYRYNASVKKHAA
ncbi:hypothetical protein LXA43DRAFT_1089895 [Ganoderma leucocontextum]|nr:hypothetical protein LXA43DRAFT_1089895 [Ganoderma leucocontextum]